MEKKTSNFSGQIGFVLAAAGSAVGVGNLWRFPYLAAKDGAVVRQGCDSFGKIRVSYDAGALKSASSSIQLDCLCSNRGSFS